MEIVAICLLAAGFVLIQVSSWRREQAPAAWGASLCLCAAIVAYSVANGAFT